MNRLSCVYLLSDVTLWCSNRSANNVAQLYILMKWLTENRSFILRDCSRRKSLKTVLLTQGMMLGAEGTQF